MRIFALRHMTEIRSEEEMKATELPINVHFVVQDWHKAVACFLCDIIARDGHYIFVYAVVLKLGNRCNESHMSAPLHFLEILLFSFLNPFMYFLSVI